MTAQVPDLIEYRARQFVVIDSNPNYITAAAPFNRMGTDDIVRVMHGEYTILKRGHFEEVTV
jgi:hypothetical protein